MMNSLVVVLMAFGLAANTLALARVDVTPSGRTVPANLLRIELRFGRPLAAVDMQFVHLLDSSGKRIEDAFLDIGLPDRDDHSFAILMHPGRIKTGVGPNLAVGPALPEGQDVTLVVDDPRLAHAVTRTWRVGAPTSSPITPARWKLKAPVAASREPLSIAFPSAINASAVGLIAVAASDGTRLPGTSVLGAGETEWRFVPASAWKPGSYKVRVHSTLEDPAGNRLCSAFEQRNQSAQRCDDEAQILFRVAPKPTRRHS